MPNLPIAMHDARVSVIIPAHNAEPFLEETIESVLGQSWPAAEIIVVNDGSSDDTAGVAARFGSRITYFEQANAGASVARNRGVEESQGSHLAFLDADDLWTADKLEVQLNALAEDRDLDVVFAHMIEFDERTRSSDGQPARSVPRPAQHASAMLVRRASFLRVGPFQPGLKIAEWFDWCLRAKELGLRDRILPHVLLHRRIHGHNSGLIQVAERQNLARVVKESLDRRRLASAVREG